MAGTGNTRQGKPFATSLTATARINLTFSSLQIWILQKTSLHLSSRSMTIPHKVLRNLIWEKTSGTSCWTTASIGGAFKMLAVKAAATCPAIMLRRRKSLCRSLTVSRRKWRRVQILEPCPTHLHHEQLTLQPWAESSRPTPQKPSELPSWNIITKRIKQTSCSWPKALGSWFSKRVTMVRTFLRNEL